MCTDTAPPPSPIFLGEGTSVHRLIKSISYGIVFGNCGITRLSIYVRIFRLQYIQYIIQSIFYSSQPPVVYPSPGDKTVSGAPYCPLNWPLNSTVSTNLKSQQHTEQLEQAAFFFISDSHTAWTTLWPLHCPKFSGTVSISFRDNIASSIRIWTVSITGNILYFLLVSEVSIYLTIPKELFTLTWKNEGNYVRVVTQFFQNEKLN